MVIVSWSVYGAMWQWPILVAKVELCFDGWNFTWIRKFVKKNRFLRNLGKKKLQNLWKICLVLELLCCFRIAGEIGFFGRYLEVYYFTWKTRLWTPKTQNATVLPNIIFFRHFWYFSITKAIYTYVLAKFEKNSIFSFSTPPLDFHRRPLLNHFLSFIQCSDIVYKGLIRLTVFTADSF